MCPSGHNQIWSDKYVDMDLVITQYIGEEDGEVKWTSVSLGFYLISTPPRNQGTVKKAILKPPADQRRRSLIYKLLEDVPFYLFSKERNKVRMTTRIPFELWTALEVLCTSKFTLKSETYSEWMNLPKEKLIQQLKAIRIAEELRGKER